MRIKNVIYTNIVIHSISREMVYLEYRIENTLKMLHNKR